MREIKFRWVGLNKHFNQIQIQEGITTSDIINGNVLSFFAESNRGESGNCKFISEDLFTGLKDKTGKEIYEGDIVHVNEYYSGDIRIKAYNGFIRFDDGEFHIKSIHCDEELDSSTIKNYGIEVIGNIHTDKQLLEK